MRSIRRLMPFIAVCLMLFSFNISAAPKNIDGNGANSTAVVNINTATVEELETLKGIGESKANAIIAYRDDQGKYKVVEDLTNVRGISDNTVASLLEKNPDRIIAK